MRSKTVRMEVLPSVGFARIENFFKYIMMVGLQCDCAKASELHTKWLRWPSALCLFCRRFLKVRKGLPLPAGPVVKNLPANAGDTGSIPGPGRFHS